MIKNIVYFFPTFSHFFVTAADYPEHGLFLLKVLLLFNAMFNDSNQVGGHTGIW